MEKQAYQELLKSGMFWEFYPDLTGNWEKDKGFLDSLEAKRELEIDIELRKRRVVEVVPVFSDIDYTHEVSFEVSSPAGSFETLHWVQARDRQVVEDVCRTLLNEIEDIQAWEITCPNQVTGGN